jgi:predicted AAA+ superfamily ATPase
MEKSQLIAKNSMEKSQLIAKNSLEKVKLKYSSSVLLYMLRRKMTDILMRWKESHENECLLVMGARQVGKTFIVEDFAKKNYKNYIYMNFELNPSLKDIFKGSLNVDDLIIEISSKFRNVRLAPGETLIFLDEIQSCPRARVSLKSFALDGRFDVIASGSLLGVSLREVSSYPVGYEMQIWMHSLDFEEFLWALGVDEAVITHVRECVLEKRPLSQSMNETMSEYFRWHMVVGGMPEAVKSFIKNRDLNAVLSIQNKIIGNYMNDISKYAPKSLKSRAMASLRSVPLQLSRRNKRFMLSAIDSDRPKYTGALENSVEWLHQAGIIEYCNNVCEPVVPLAWNSRTGIYKAYMRDTGLLISMMEAGVSNAVINRDAHINRGAIMENIIAETMIKKGIELFYFERKSGLEVDFIVNLGGTAAAIEVKSGNNSNSKSLKTVMSEAYKVRRGIKFENSNIFVDDAGVEHYPQFAAAFLLPDHPSLSGEKCIVPDAKTPQDRNEA